MPLRRPQITWPDSGHPFDWPSVPYPPPADAQPAYLVSWSARRYVSDHGGRLYVWTRVRGRRLGWTVLDASVMPPSGIDFQRPITVDGIELCLTRPADTRIKYQLMIHRALGRFVFSVRETLRTERRYVVHVATRADP